MTDYSANTEQQKTLAAQVADQLHWDDRGLLPAVVQDAATREVLMVAWMNRESLALTFATWQAVFWSRSRGELWHKGATSGNVMHIQEIRVDCDEDVLLLLVDPAGPACHTGATSCFFRTAEALVSPEGLKEINRHD